eukprot:440056_1
MTTQQSSVKIWLSTATNDLPSIPCYAREAKQPHHESWKSLNKFPTSLIQHAAFSINGTDTIIYSTNYDREHAGKGGIFQYYIKTDSHKTIQLWKTTKYCLGGYVSIYNPTTNEIIFVGGYDYCNNSNCESIVIFSLNNKTMKHIDIKTEIGKEARLALTHNDLYLHIVGGTKNDHHIIINLETNKVLKKENNIYSFKKIKLGSTQYVGDVYAQYGIMGHQLIYNKLTNTLIMLGGYTDSKTSSHFSCHILRADDYTYFDFWTLDLSDINNNKWKPYKTGWKLPQYMGFTSVLYDNRIIINFGGWGYQRCIDDVYYMDIFGDGKWKIAEVKCPKPGKCNVVITDNKTVHVLPWDRYTDHFCINIADLLPETVLNANHLNDDQKHNDDIKCNQCDEMKEKVSVLETKVNSLQTLINDLLSMQSKMEMDREENNRVIQQYKIQNDRLNDECKEMKMELVEVKKKLKELKRKNIDPTKFREWSGDEFVDWICGLEQGKYIKYESSLRNEFGKEDISGQSISDIEKNDWKGWGINNFAHRSNIQKHINNLVQQNNNNVKNNQIAASNMKCNEGTDTPYI